MPAGTERRDRTTACPARPFDTDRHFRGRSPSQSALTSELTANVEKVVTRFVQGVHGHPAERSLTPRWVVVHRASPVPFFGRQSRKVIRVQMRGLSELAHNMLGVLLGVAVVVNTLVATHR